MKIYYMRGLLLNRGPSQAKVAPMTEEIWPTKRLGENIRQVPRSSYLIDAQLILAHLVPDVVIFDPDMFALRVPYLVLSKADGGIIVAKNTRGFMVQETDALQKHAQEDGFPCGITERDIFRIA